MGLLDALFNSDSFGGQGGGLLDLLKTTQMQNSQYQPGPGFAPQQPQTPSRSFDSSMFDPSTYAPNQAQPIGVGDYQMPRIGDASQFAPNPAAIPPAAQAAQGQMPQGQSTDISAQSRQPDQQLPPAFGQQSSGIGGNALTGLQSFLNGGGLISSIRGAMNGQRTDPQGMAQQNLKAQFDSLVPILGPQKAMLAVMNPEAGKTLINEAMTNKQEWGVVSEDPFAGKKYGFINKYDQTINDKPIAQGGASVSSSPLADMENAKAAGVSGDALYGYLPKQIAPMVKAMVEGRQPLPSGAAMRNPATLALIDAAHSVDPTFDATSWGTRVKGQADYYGGGKSSEIMRKANQSALHFGELVSDKMAELPGHDMPAVNALANLVNTNLLGKGAQGNFEVNAHALADELAGLFKGANLSDTEIRAWESKLSPNMSVEQQRGMAKTLLGLYRDSVTALEKKRVESIGQAAADKKGPILGPEADAALAGVEKFANGGPRASPASGVDKSAIEAEMRKRGLLK